MKYYLALISTLVLTACGGGGGFAGSPVSPQITALESTFPCVTAQTPGPNQHRVVGFDVPRDLGVVTAQGIPAMSIENVALQLNRAKCVGFDTVSLHTFIPIDSATGLIQNYDPLAPGGDQNKSMPKDYWKYVDYAKKIGLRVVIRATPAEYRSDALLHNSGFPNIPVKTMLATLNSYYSSLAQQAQAHGVDVMYIGYFQMGFDTASYAREWQTIVDSVRSVYRGKIAYATCSQCTNNVVWSMVDIVGVQIKPSQMTACSATISEIKKSYEADAQRIVNIKSSYSNKTLWLDQILIDTLGCNLTSYANTWDLFQTNQMAVLENSSSRSWQSNSIRAVFEVVAGQLNSQVSGVEFGQYLPWLQGSGFQSPKTLDEQLWNLFDKLSYSLYNNSEAQFTLGEYLGKPWGYRIYY